MRPATFENPVYGHDFADPFVLRHAGRYWAFATGYGADGGCFPVLRSADLVAWVPAASAMAPLPERPPCMWAPEVWYEEGRFYLYYSAGDEENMELRVAVATDPGGPYVDAGVRLTNEKFAIDAHVFRDRDGAKYLFYATDFLEHTHIGTGVVVDRMRDPVTLEGAPRPVVRARYAWQIYDPKRASKGGVCWHTVEGPFVLEREGRYAMMFSGGNWQNDSYGVSFATAREVLGDGEWTQRCDGEGSAPILTTAPGVRGPGHNSVVRGPDNRQLYCVYHYWPEDQRGRVVAIDRLEWVGDRLVVQGPTVGPQAAPNRTRNVARIATDGENATRHAWAPSGGTWRETDRGVAQERGDGETSAVLTLDASSFLFEVTLSPTPPDRGDWSAGIALRAGLESVSVRFGASGVTVDGLAVDEERRFGWPPAGLSSDRLVRVEVSGREVRLDIEGVGRWRGVASVAPKAVVLATASCAVEFVAPSATIGWEERFEDGHAPAARRGWRPPSGESTSGGPTLVRETGCADYELVVAARLGPDDRSSATLFPTASATQAGPRLDLARTGDAWEVRLDGTKVAAATRSDDVQIVHVRKTGAVGKISMDGGTVATISLPERPTHIGVGVEGPARFDLVRVTELWPGYGEGGER